MSSSTILLAVYAQVSEEGLSALWLALAVIVAGTLLYFPFRRLVKPGITDVDPFRAES